MRSWSRSFGEAFSFWHSVFYLAGAVVGGIASPWGAVRALLITAVPFFSSAIPAIPPIVLGAAVLLSVLLLPRGLVGLAQITLATKPNLPPPSSSELNEVVPNAGATT